MAEKAELEVASQELVAHKLTRDLIHTLNSEGEAYRRDYLNLYAECLIAARGRRKAEDHKS